MPIGSAGRGLCGGMVFTALDVFTAGLPPLLDGRPAPGSPLFEYLVRRLFDSWNIPGGVARYYSGMVRGKALRPEVWSGVRSELDAGRPCPLGLITARSANPLRLGQNHLVLAYGYAEAGAVVTVRVYDPNTALSGADGVHLRLGLASPAAIEHNAGIGQAVRGFFPVRYTASDPSGLEPPR